MMYVVWIGFELLLNIRLFSDSTVILKRITCTIEKLHTRFFIIATILCNE